MQLEPKHTQHDLAKHMLTRRASLPKIVQLPSVPVVPTSKKMPPPWGVWVTCDGGMLGAMQCVHTCASSGEAKMRH